MKSMTQPRLRLLYVMFNISGFSQIMQKALVSVLVGVKRLQVFEELVVA